MQNAITDAVFYLFIFGLPIAIIWRINSNFAKRREAKRQEKLHEPLPTWIKQQGE